MSRKNHVVVVLVAALLGLGQARGQGAGSPYAPGQGMPPAGPGLGAAAPGPGAAAPEADRAMPFMGKAPPGPLTELAPPTQGPANLSLSSWVRYPRGEGCCGPLCDGPIGAEVFLRAGVAFPVGAGVFGDVLRPGWAIDVGGRALFFDPGLEAAWTLTTSVSNVNNNSSDPRQVPITVNVQGTPFTGQGTITGLNRTYVNLGAGRDWWLWGPADGPGQTENFRVGFDAGGRYGTERLEVAEIRHLTDVIGGVYAGVHADLEWACGGCVFQAGVRGEYSYTWGDILKNGNSSDVQELLVLIRAGIRF